jgi:hypothetical protein
MKKKAAMKRRNPLAPRNPYEPKADELAAAQRHLAREKGTPPVPNFRFRAVTDGVVRMDVDHPEPIYAYKLIADAFATSDFNLVDGILRQLVDASRTGKTATDQELNFLVSVVRGINPQDPTETLLAAQMAVVHNATMVAAQKLNFVARIDQQDSASSLLNKLARTFAIQVETLKKYRSTGEQSIRVQHVTVNEGGQAIVGNVQTGGGGNNEKPSQSHALGALAPAGAIDARGAALHSEEQALGPPLSSARRTRPVSVPDARGNSRSAKGEG